MPTKYSQIAENHWRTTQPDRYRALEDPQTFFGQLGEEIETQVQELAQRLAGPDEPGEEYLQKVGRLNMARLQAEEAILAELVWTSSEEPEEPEFVDPMTAWVTETMRAIHAADPDDEQIDD